MEDTYIPNIRILVALKDGSMICCERMEFRDMVEITLPSNPNITIMRLNKSDIKFMKLADINKTIK